MNDPVVPDSPILPGSSPNPYGPLTPGRMFARTTVLLRENFRLFFGIVAVVIGVEIVVGGVLGAGGVWMQHAATGASPVAKAFLLAPLTVLGSILIYIFTQIIQGALFLATQAKLANLPTSVGDACKFAAEKVWRLIGISVLVGLRILGYVVLMDVAAVVLLVFVALVFGGGAHVAGQLPLLLLRMGHGPLSGPGILIAVFLLALVVVYVGILFWLVIRYSISIPAALAENLSVTDAIRRSIRLTRGSKGRLLALFLTTTCAWILVVIVTLPIQLIAGHVSQTHSGSTPATVVLLHLSVAIVRILFSWIAISFVGVATALCYFDLRVRKEGFGAGMQVPAPEPGLIPLPPAPEAPVLEGPVSGDTISGSIVDDRPIS